MLTVFLNVSENLFEISLWIMYWSDLRTEKKCQVWPIELDRRKRSLTSLLTFLRKFCGKHCNNLYIMFMGSLFYIVSFVDVLYVIHERKKKLLPAVCTVTFMRISADWATCICSIVFSSVEVVWRLMPNYCRSIFRSMCHLDHHLVA